MKFEEALAAMRRGCVVCLSDWNPNAHAIALCTKDKNNTGIAYAKPSWDGTPILIPWTDRFPMSWIFAENWVIVWSPQTKDSDFIQVDAAFLAGGPPDEKEAGHCNGQCCKAHDSSP